MTAPMAAEPTSVSYLSFSKASPAPAWISGFYKDSRCRHIYSDSRNSRISDQTSSPLSGVPDTGTGKVLFLLYYTGNVKNDQKIACFSHCFPIFFPL